MPEQKPVIIIPVKHVSYAFEETVEQLLKGPAKPKSSLALEIDFNDLNIFEEIYKKTLLKISPLDSNFLSLQYSEFEKIYRNKKAEQIDAILNKVPNASKELSGRDYTNSDFKLFDPVKMMEFYYKIFC